MTGDGGADRVVVVGRRRAALRVVQELGLDAVLVAPRPPRHGLLQPVQHVAWSPADDPLGRELAARSGEIPSAPGPVAVLAATEGAVLPAARLRHALGLPGLGPQAALRCTDKLEMKRAVSSRGIACARYMAVEPTTRADGLVDRLGLPLVLKPRVGSGSRGTRIVRTAGDVPPELPGRWMAESFVAGTEASVEALVMDGERRLVNCTEYLEPGWANQLPARLPEATEGELRRLLDRAVAALGVDRGMVHMEVFLTSEGPVFGELAARPPGGYVMELLGLAWGFDAWRAWVQTELGAEPPVPERPVAHAASRILHPGPGRVVAAAGLDVAREVAGVVEAVLRVAVGDRIEGRRGTGQEAGHVVVRGDTREAAVESLRRVTEAIRLEVEGRDDG